MAAACARLVVVVGCDHVEKASAELADAGIDAAVCAGGATRTDSVAAGLRVCHALELHARDLVGIHDAARPLATADLVERVFGAVSSEWDGAAPGLPVVDTLKLVGRHLEVQRTVDRQGLWSVQTPQVFRWEALAQAYARRTEAATDDLAVVEQSGGRIRLIRGDPFNFKVTYPHDLALAEALLAGAAGREPA
jgi:2-C-methyl-D-erythritol 4-phosphate cytidylyltransferase